MINPYGGILLNGYFFDYDPSSFKESYDSRKSSEDTQLGRKFTGATHAPADLSIVIHLQNETPVQIGTSTIGVTTWLGVSQKQWIIDNLYQGGNSYLVYFVDPAGITHNVVAVGSVVFDPLLTTPKGTGFEYRASLSLQER